MKYAILIMGLLLLSACGNVITMQEVRIETAVDCEKWEENNTQFSKCIKNTYVCEYSNPKGYKKCLDIIGEMETED